MPHAAPLRTLIVSLLLAAALAACGGLPPGAARAQQLLDRGDYAGASAAADAELARFPREPTLWRVKIRAALGEGDAATAVSHYEAWRALRGDDDRGALRLMALATLWQGLRSPSASVRLSTVQVVERLELEQLAEDVAERMTDDDDAVAAAAAVAVLMTYPQAAGLVTQLLDSPDPHARAIAVEGIGRKVGRHARADLTPALDDPDAGVRAAAVAAFAAMADPADTARLTSMAVKDAAGPVRATAIAALAGRTPVDSSVAARRAFTDLCLADAYLGVRLGAVPLLADDEALAALVRSDDRMVALRAAIALHKRDRDGDDALLRAAVDAAIGDLSWPVRASAYNQATAILGRDAAARLAASGISDKSLPVQLAAARVLLAAGERDAAVTALAATLAAAAGDDRLQAGLDLVRADDDRGLAAITDAARAPDADLRLAAVRGHRTLRRLTAALPRAIADDSPAVRVAAAEELLRLTAD